MAKVILLDSPSWKLFDPNSFLHLGILYLAGSLREAGHDVQVMDCHEITQWDKDNERLIIDHSMLMPCDVLGVSATTANVHWGKMLAKVWPAKVKVLGGSHATYIVRGPHQRFQQKAYFDGFDFLMVEESEESFVQFCDGIDKGDVSQVPNLCWFNKLGFLQRNPLSALPDVNKIAPPAFDLWPHKFYDGVFAPGNHGMIAQTFYARGCPYGCKFCADARTKIREESFERIEHQAKQLASLGVTCVRIYDDVLTIKGERCRKIADIMAAHGLRFRGNTRVNLTDKSLFQYLASKGCVELGFGCEHGSAKMLKAMDKGTTPEKNTEGIHMAQDAGMIAKAYLMLGFPGETLETVAELKDWIIRTRPSACSWNFFQPYPGSDVWNHPERYSVEIPDNAFDKFWQTGDELSEDLIYLDIKTITKPQLVQAHREISALIDSEIGHRDRRRQDNYFGEARMQ